MRLYFGRRQFLAAAALGSVGSLSGCGLLLYPERRGQPGGRLDWGVVLLDGIGLLLFFIPGVIAFAVDFATGAIYLPPDPPPYPLPGERPAEFGRIQVEAEQITPRAIAQAVSSETGVDVRLEAGTYDTRPLRDIGDFWTAVDELAAAHARQPSPDSGRA